MDGIAANQISGQTSAAQFSPRQPAHLRGKVKRDALVAGTPQIDLQVPGSMRQFEHKPVFSGGQVAQNAALPSPPAPKRDGTTDRIVGKSGFVIQQAEQESPKLAQLRFSALIVAAGQSVIMPLTPKSRSAQARSASLTVQALTR